MRRAVIIVLLCTFLPLLTGLGFWQLSRYHEKLALEQEFLSRKETLMSPANLHQHKDPRYYRVFAIGRFDNTRSFYLDNRTFQGQTGVNVITPFTTTTGYTLLVDRGWLATPAQAVPDIPEIVGPVTVTGLSWIPAGEAFLLQKDIWSNFWPKRIQAIDLPRMQDTITAAEPWMLVLDEQQPGSLQANFSLINMSPERHMGYAVQWFLMALALLLLSLWALYRLRTERHAENNNNSAVQGQNL